MGDQRKNSKSIDFASRQTVAVTCWLIFSCLCQATDLTGVILDNNGKPVSGARVTVARSSVDGPLPAAEAYSTTTASDGSYTVKGLTAGPFIVCASAPAQALLDPCQWGTPAVVRLPAGTGAVNTTTRLQLGATVSIRVDDPALSLYSSVAAGQPHPLLDMGVWPADGHFHHALHKSSDSTGHDFILVVAPNVNFAFAVSAQNIAIADATTQSAVDANQRVSVNLAPGATLQLHFNATASASATPSTKQ